MFMIHKKKILFLLFLFTLFFISCKKENTTKTNNSSILTNSIVANSVDRDLEDIKKDGVLRALVVYSSTSYFLYKGQPMGFEYEILQRLAKHLNLKLEIVISDDLDAEFEVLNRGDVDIIAHGMTITNQRKWEVDFTEYLYLTKQVLVQKKPDNFRTISWSALQKQLIDDPMDLIGDTVSIRKNSAYHERIESLSNELGGTIYIDTLDSKLSTGEIIDMVVNGEIKYTIADENLAKINASTNPILKIDVPISFSQRIAWVTRKKSKNLTNVVNQWILKQRKTTDYFVIYNKYFKNRKSISKRIESNYYLNSTGVLSPYDELIKKYAKELPWNWELLASQVYQESKFDPKARSWASAHGLLQLMPATAKELGVSNPSDPEQSIRGGVKYLKRIWERWSEIPDSLERIKFTLASYNAGFEHIQDARTLTKINNGDPNIWEGQVEKSLLNLTYQRYYSKPEIKYGYVHGIEPVKYVNEILDRNTKYKTLFENH